MVDAWVNGQKRAPTLLPPSMAFMGSGGGTLIVDNAVSTYASPASDLGLALLKQMESIRPDQGVDSSPSLFAGRG